MRRIAFAAGAACLLAAAAAAAQAPAPGRAVEEQRVLRFVSDMETPPFSFRERGGPAGFEIELGDALGKKLGAQVEWKREVFSPAVFQSLLATGKADAAIACISITPERRRQFDFTMPYFVTGLAIAAPGAAAWDHAAFAAGLKDRAVGVQKRSTGEEWAKSRLPAARRVVFSSPERMAEALREGRVSCIVIDEEILRGIMRNPAYRFAVVEKGLTSERYGIAVQKGESKLASELDEALAKLGRDGSYGRLFEKWFRRPADLPADRPARAEAAPREGSSP